MIDNHQNLLDAIGRCELFFEGEVISGEPIIKTAMDFFAGGFFSKQPRQRALLHTGSIAFDATAVFLASIADILLFYKQDTEFLSQLHPGDFVIYWWPGDGKPDRQQVEEVVSGKHLKVWMTKTCTRTIPRDDPKMQYFAPNPRGQSIGRRGLSHNSSQERNRFFENLFKIPASALNVPRTYTAIVADQDYARRLYEGLSVRYTDRNGKQQTVPFQQLAGAIYGRYEERGDFISLGGALSGENAVLRFCPSLATARNIVGVSGSNTSLLVLSSSEIIKDPETFRELSAARKPSFVYTSTSLGSPADEIVLEVAGNNAGQERTWMACTRALLKEFVTEADDNEESIVGNLRAQIRHASTWKIERKLVGGFLPLQRYMDWGRTLHAFQSIPFDEHEHVLRGF